MDPADMRISYERGSLDERDASADPLVQFDAWFTAAEAAGVLELSAMTLATVGADDRPSTRIVLLKGYDADGVVFFKQDLNEPSTVSLPINSSQSIGSRAGCTHKSYYNHSLVQLSLS